MTRPRSTRGQVDILAFFDSVFGQAPSWQPWRTFIKALFALKMTPTERALYAACTARTEPPIRPATEALCVIGRRGGKSRVASFVAVFLACCRDYSTVLAPGETGVLMVVASDRRQAGVVFRYIAAMIEGHPVLSQLVVRKTADTIDLSTHISIQIVTSSYRTTRGFTCVGCVCDETSFWADDTGANPASEVIAAIRPSLSTTYGLLLNISTPYSRSGPVFDAYEQHYGRNDDPVLVWTADTRTMNISIDAAIVEAAYTTDPESAASEYGRDGYIRFRSDLSLLIDRAPLNACIVAGRRELPPEPGAVHQPFIDVSGAVSDSFGVCIVRKELDGRVVVCLLREWKAPYDPAVVVPECATLLKRYGCLRATGDRYGAQWPVSAFATHGIDLQHSEQSKSELFIEFVALVNSSRVELLDHARSINQLAGLQRRTSRGGRDSVEHGRAGDDLANVIAGASVLAVQGVGLPRLPSTFTCCARARSGLSMPSPCYLLGGGYIPTLDGICSQCPGDQHVRAARRVWQQRHPEEMLSLPLFYQRHIDKTGSWVEHRYASPAYENLLQVWP